MKKVEREQKGEELTHGAGGTSGDESKGHSILRVRIYGVPLFI